MTTSARRRAANRANARASTGPRTGEGKARSAQNARRHGLNLSALGNPLHAGEIDALARAIAGADAGARQLRLAYRIAAAQIDLGRSRRARHELLSSGAGNPDTALRLYMLDSYERRALSRRKFAIRDFDDANGSWPRGGRVAHFGETKPRCRNATLATTALPRSALHAGGERAQSRAEGDFAPTPSPAYTGCTSNAAAPEQCGGRGRATS